MRTVVLGPPPAELQALITRRHSLGLDGFDGVWKGHMAWLLSAPRSIGRRRMQNPEPSGRSSDLPLPQADQRTRALTE
jgi:hypothetical protein